MWYGNGSETKGESHSVYCIVGDGECNEGIIWEAAFNAAKYKLDNLIAIVDINGFQLSGVTSEVMPINLVALWKASGWEVSHISTVMTLKKCRRCF